MVEIELRYMKISDAERFYEILSNPNFSYFEVNIESVEDEREWLKEEAQRREKSKEYNYAILYEGELVGGCGIAVDQRQKHTAEIGYFVDEDYWNRGIATEGVKKLEKIAFDELELVRLEIRMEPENTASERVALKCGYHKEGVIRKAYLRDDKYRDCLLYSKVR
ncbi:MAG: GNAT family N-acetyltransferase [Thermoplasmata archaeon]